MKNLISMTIFGLMLWGCCKDDYKPTSPACVECAELKIPSTAYYLKAQTTENKEEYHLLIIKK
jgi:hypothetical protein